MIRDLYLMFYAIFWLFINSTAITSNLRAKNKFSSIG